MKGYVFIANSTKPSAEKRQSREMYKSSNVVRPCAQAALNRGYDVFVGINRNNPQELECDMPVKLFDQNTYRSITDLKENYKAYKNMCKLLEENDIEVIHCNTPVGGLVGRICGKKYKVKKIIYTAHGFHFYKGAPLFNRTVIKWAEMLMAHWTDAIITMNTEDYEAAKKFKLRNNGKAYYIHGVGVDTKAFNVECDKEAKLKELGLKETDTVLISMGDLIKRKNYSPVIEAVAKLKNPDVHYLICGRGPELENLTTLAKSLGVESQIHFLGFRTDVKELLQIADVFVFSTLQEGLPRSLMEAMSVGIPCVVSKIRGNVDLVEDGVNGFLCGTNDSDGFAEAIKKLTEDEALRNRMKEENLKKICDYDVAVVSEEIEKIYGVVIG